MQDKEKSSGRRRHERWYGQSSDHKSKVSLPDQSRRHGNRRRHERRNLSFEISLPDQVGKTINVSESGVYLEVITNDMNVHSPGTTILLKITAVNTTPGFDGKGTVIRNCTIENPDHDDSLCVALELTENLILY